MKIKFFVIVFFDIFKNVNNISGCHIAAYKKNPSVNLVAFCDINERTLKKRGEEWGVTALYTDADEMFKNERIDAVSVCTWNAAHAAMTIKALRAGKHVLCEKPMALNAAEAEEMARVVKETGKILMIGFVRRYCEATKIAKEFIDNGALGEVYLAEAKYLRRHGNPGGWFCVKEYSGGIGKSLFGQRRSTGRKRKICRNRKCGLPTRLYRDRRGG